MVVKLAGESRAYGHTWNLGGAGIITQREFVKTAVAMAGKTPRLIVAGKWMKRLIGIFDPFMRELVEMHYLLPIL